jgi:tRNA threonylcarbamoyladenosine biosynthesis protein TsaE
MKFESFSTENTQNLAYDMAKNAKSGQIFCLSGNLGAGKTAFAKGFALGLGYEGRVTSPTFTLMNEYIGGRLPVYHFDLYRLENGLDDLENIGYEDYFNGTGVCLVEWAESAFDDLVQSGFVIIKISADESRGGDFREIHIENFGN